MKPLIATVFLVGVACLPAFAEPPSQIEEKKGAATYSQGDAKKKREAERLKAKKERDDKIAELRTKVAAHPIDKFVNADALLKACRDNIVAARKDYGDGQRIEVMGVVEKVSDGLVFLNNGERFNLSWVCCRFGSGTDLADVKVNSIYSIQGKLERTTIGSVSMGDCRFLSATEAAARRELHKLVNEKADLFSELARVRNEIRTVGLRVELEDIASSPRQRQAKIDGLRREARDIKKRLDYLKWLDGEGPDPMASAASAKTRPANTNPEQQAATKLRLAKMALTDAQAAKDQGEATGLRGLARKRLAEIVEKYPNTKAGKEAKKLLEQ